MTIDVECDACELCRPVIRQKHAVPLVDAELSQRIGCNCSSPARCEPIIDEQHTQTPMIVFQRVTFRIRQTGQNF